MKSMIKRLVLASLLALSHLASAYQPTPIEQNTKAPDFELLGVDGKKHALKDFTGGRALVVIFTTNHCPDAIASFDRMIKLVDDFGDKGVKFVAINSNSPEGLHMEELGWTAYDDSYETMKLVSRDLGFNLPYLYDGDTQEVAKAYGAVATPHVFVFDDELKLKYNGRMDDARRRLGPAEKNEARDAIAAVLAGKEPAITKTRPHGCGTKWKEKAGHVANMDQKWNDRPVTLAEVDVAGLKKLVANKGRTGLRLFNIWSTACGPCIVEFPDLVDISRRYSWNEFEFIPISLDPVESKDKVLKFLEEKKCGLPARVAGMVKADGRTTNNLIFKGDPEDLAEVLDPDWNGAQPHTVLVGAEGEVLFRHTGIIDPLELRKKIVEQIWKQ